MGKNSVSAQRPDTTCTWCKERFENGVDRELHVSKLGAAGEFHHACFAEYEQTTTP
jgi:hypothetical protein